MVYSRGTRASAYQSVATHSGVAMDDPHRLTLMLLDGALARLAAARGCIEHNVPGEKAKLLHRSIEIIQELRGSLDLSAGGQIAANLDELYDYIERRLLKANLESNPQIIAEVSSLVQTIRDGWAEIHVDARSRPTGT